MTTSTHEHTPTQPVKTAEVGNNGDGIGVVKENKRMLWGGWVIAHAIQALIILTLGWGAEDLHYYRTGEAGIPTTGEAHTAEPLSEYPHAGAWPIYLVRYISGIIDADSEFWFVVIFVAMCMVLSGSFMWFLLRTGRVNGAWLWVGVALLIGPIFASRLDLISGLAVGIAVAVAAVHPRIAGGLLAFATASKLWPGVIGAAFVGRWNSRGTWSRLVSFAVGLLVLVGITVATAGFDRVLSPLDYQEERGLQVESIAATPHVFMAMLNTQWQIDFTSSKSFEITGPGVSVGLQFADLLMVVTILLALAVALWRFIRGGWTRDRSMAFTAVLISMLIVSNKVFSPQYVLWLAPIVCLGLARPSKLAADASTADHRVQILGYLLLGISALSFLIFPITYSWLVMEGPRALAVFILLFRNVLMVVATGMTFAWWIATERAPAIPSGVPLSRVAISEHS